ncbi:MAG: hypothetical protein H6550_09185 [Chitinophagales bacterium]|nr:hypothetical protein [Chitinophagales bacterium]
MKQKMTWWLVVIVALCTLQGEAYAQRHKTSCPPKRSFWRSHKQHDKLVKFPQLTRKGKRQQEKEDRVYVAEQRSEQQKEQKKRDNMYLPSRSVKFRELKTADKDIASTKCPRR